MASDSLLVIGQGSPRGGQCDQQFLFVHAQVFIRPSRPQIFFFFKQKWLIHPTCAPIPPLIFSPFFPFIFTFHAHSLQIIVVHTHSQAYTCTKCTSLRFGPLFCCTYLADSDSYKHFWLAYTPDSHHIKPLCCL